MRFFFVGNLQIRGAAFVHSRAAAVLGIEVVLTGLPRENLAVLRDLEAFRI